MSNNDPPLSECPEPIAIVGMGCRWPGDVSTPSQLWDLLINKRSGYSDFPPDRVNVGGFYHPSRDHPGTFYTQGGYFLSGDPNQLDHALFGISPVEARTLDPAQRKLLEVTFEAFDNAGEPWQKFSGSNTGVFVGNFNADHQIMTMQDADHSLPYATTGSDPAILSNRVNYVFNLLGPSETVNTACSSSMYALHHAVSALRAGDCEKAIVAGTNIILDPTTQIFTTKLGAISPTSTCHTFDLAADGYARADGFGALYIMKLSTAVEGFYPIRAVIRGTAINANGRGAGITQPSAEGQAAVIRQAYKSAGSLDTALTGYFECHGTGTPVGDPIEVSAVGEVFSKISGDAVDLLLIGSVKTNLGHSESASGIAGIMKAVLALEKGVIPPTIGLVNPNPNIDFEGAGVHVVTEATNWPKRGNGYRRVSVNSFGYGGANAHVILDSIDSVMPEYRCTSSRLDIVPTVPTQHTSCQPFILFPFSAHDEVSLRANIARTFAVAPRYRARDLAYTLGVRKTRFLQRAFVVVPLPSGTEILPATFDLNAVTFSKSPSVPARNIGYVFTGQGAQWAGMAAGLMADCPTFRRRICSFDQLLGTLPVPPSWRIEHVLANIPGCPDVNKPEVSQIVCTAVQVGLVELLSTWGIKPAAVVGHSSGEIAAAFAASRLTAEEAIVFAYLRGYAVSKHPHQGSMLAVGLDVAGVKPYLVGIENKVEIAAMNASDSTTLSGDASIINSVAKKLQQEGVFARILKTGDNAYHSRHMQGTGELYEELVTEALSKVPSAEVHPSQSPVWISSVFPSKDIKPLQVGPRYWRQNLESPVQFSAAVERMAQLTDLRLDVVIEIGPHPALGGPMKTIRRDLGERGHHLPASLATLQRNTSCVASLLQLAGSLFLRNCPVDLQAVNSMHISTTTSLSQELYPCLDLPLYAYNYGSTVHHETRPSKEWRQRKHLHHDLLGARQRGGSALAPSWRNVLRLKDVPWLADHKLVPKVIFPAAGYLAMAVEAKSQVHHEQVLVVPITGYSFRNVAIKSTMEVPDDDFGVDIVLSMYPLALSNATTSLRWHNFKITSVRRDRDTWTEHCSGQICVEIARAAESSGGMPAILGNATNADVAEWYTRLEKKGLGYGPSFRGIHASTLTCSSKQNEATAMVHSKPALTSVKSSYQPRYPLHPTAIDACLQLALIAAHGGRLDAFQTAYVPVLFDEMTIWHYNERDTSGLLNAWAHAERRGLRGLYGQVRLNSPSGASVMTIKSVRCVTYNSGLDLEETDVAQHYRNPFYRLVWRPDIDSLSNESAQALFPPQSSREDVESIFADVDRLSAYVLVSISLAYRDAENQPESQPLQAFLAWVHRCFDGCVSGRVRFGIEAIEASSVVREKIIADLFVRLEDVIEAKLVQRVFVNIGAILSGIESGLKLALEDGLLSELYKTGVGISFAYPQLQNMIDIIAHKESRMKIIEVGAGTGGATRLLMETLKADSGFRRYREYTFTDVTTSFLADAELEFSKYPSMAYKILDIEKDPIDQGYTPTYDLVVASQVLHAASVIAEAVRNCRSLLRAGGKMVLLELTHAHIATGLVLGTFPDYWKSRDGRVDTPLMGRAEWNAALRQNGFSGIDIVLNDHPQGLETASVILTTAVDPVAVVPSAPRPRTVIWLVYNTATSGMHQEIAQQLADKDYDPVFLPLTEANSIPRGAHLLSLVEFELVAAIFTAEAMFEGLKCLVSQASSILWVSQGDAVRGSDPTTGLMVGFLHTLANEMPSLRISHFMVDVNSDDTGKPHVAKAIIDCAIQLQSAQSFSAQDTSFTFHNGCVHVSRVEPDTNLKKKFEIQNKLQDHVEERQLGTLGPVKLCFQKPGLLGSLVFEDDFEMLQPLPEDWVEMRTEAMGLNIKDLAVATGRFDANNFSCEACGTVTKVGALVQNLAPGDRVYGAIRGNFGNSVRGPAIFLQKTSPTDTPEDMASIPVCYMTAVYALMHLARLTAGEKVLIQAATGGVGIAALRIARHLGAEVYATVGTKSKENVLVEKFGIPRSHIFSSRDVSVPIKIWDSTGGVGIDVILSSSSGEYLQEMWRCIAPIGRFIEIGRLDVLERGNLPLAVFERNATFTSFDLGLISQQKPMLFASLIAEVAQLASEGVVRPIELITKYDISELEHAMMYMSKNTHMGKIVITFTNSETVLRVKPSVLRTAFDPHATYILAGCLGGVGRSIAAWMVDRGARNLSFLSRSGWKNSGALAIVEALRGCGVTITAINCDIASREDVFDAVNQISKIGKPIKGVVQAAMVLEDVAFATMTFEQMQAVLRPKVQGTVNLHEATLQHQLDFFTMTSSIVPYVGTATQISYSAANAFQDSFARFRLARSLPAQSISLGLILGVGVAGIRQDLQRSINRNGIYGNTISEIMQLMDMAFTTVQLDKGVTRDPLSSAHVLTGFEPRKLSELDNDGAATDFTWSADPRMQRIAQAVQDYHDTVHGSNATTQHSSSSATIIAKELRALAQSIRKNADMVLEQRLRSVVRGAVMQRFAKLLYVSADDIEGAKDVASYGIDSMIAAELRNWLMKTFRLDLSFLALVGKGMRVDDLIETACRALVAEE